LVEKAECFVPVKRLAGKIVSEVTCTVLNPAQQETANELITLKVNKPNCKLYEERKGKRAAI